MRTCSLADRLLSLRALLPEAEFIGADDICPLRCTSDSRRVRQGDLFAALPGDRYDGHQFIAEAIQRGATSVLCERPPSGLGVPCGVVPHVHHAYGRICQALAGNPSFNLKLIGITGTNGKTTTSCLIASVLLKAGYRVGVAGTLGYFDGQEVEPATHTTPPAETLAPLLARMVTNECTHATLEVSSHALAQSRIAGVRLDVACVTNVSRDHLDYHTSLQDYRLAKSKMLDYLAPEGFAVVNADDAIALGYLRHFHGPALTVGIRQAAEITATPHRAVPQRTDLPAHRRQRNRARADPHDRHAPYLQLPDRDRRRLDLWARPGNGRPRAGGGRLRAGPLAADRVRPAVQRVHRLCPHARCSGRRPCRPCGK